MTSVCKLQASMLLRRRAQCRLACRCAVRVHLHPSEKARRKPQCHIALALLQSLSAQVLSAATGRATSTLPSPALDRSSPSADLNTPTL